MSKKHSLGFTFFLLFLTSYFPSTFSQNSLPVTDSDIEEIVKEELETCEGTKGIYRAQKVEDILHCLKDFAIILQGTL